MWVLIGVVVFVFEASLGKAGIEQLFNQYAFVLSVGALGIECSRFGIQLVPCQRSRSRVIPRPRSAASLVNRR